MRWREICPKEIARITGRLQTDIEGHNAIGLGAVVVRVGVDGTFTDWDIAPGIRILLGGALPGFELVRYTIPVPVRGIGFRKPGVDGVVGTVELPDVIGREGPEAALIRC